MDEHATITELLDRNTRALFSRYGNPLDDAPHSDPVGGETRGLVAVVGYTGEVLTGSLCLSGAQEVLDATFSSAAGHDWLGELANQLLGRVKADLMHRGADIYLSTPVVLRGFRLELCAPTADLVHAARLIYGSPAGAISSVLQFEFEPGRSLTAPQPVEDVLVAEDMLLF